MIQVNTMIAPARVTSYSHSALPDVLDGLGIAAMNVDAARQVWRVAREEHEGCRFAFKLSALPALDPSFFAMRGPGAHPRSRSRRLAAVYSQGRQSGRHHGTPTTTATMS